MKSSNEPALHGATIVTLTMNPALDITTSADQVRPTDKIRCRGARYDAGGGGINVARVASVLGGSVSAVFPVGGANGRPADRARRQRRRSVSPRGDFPSDSGEFHR